MTVPPQPQHRIDVTPHDFDFIKPNVKALIDLLRNHGRRRVRSSELSGHKIVHSLLAPTEIMNMRNWRAAFGSWLRDNEKYFGIRWIRYVGADSDWTILTH